MNNLFFLFIFAFREYCNTQHVLIRLIKERRENLDNDPFIGVVLSKLTR